MSFFNEIFITDIYDWQAECTPMGEVRVVEPYRMVGTAYNGNTLDGNFWTSGATGTNASVKLRNGRVTLSAGTTSTGTASLQSVRTARYVGGYVSRYRGQIQSDVNANHLNRWGAFDTNDGCFFEISGTTWNAVTRYAGTNTRVASTSWNGNKTTPASPGNVNTYEIYWTNKNVWFVINDVLMHTTTSTTTPWSANKNLPIRNECTNLAGTTNYTLSCWVQTISMLGPDKTEGFYKYIATNSTTVCKLGGGRLHRIINNDNVGTVNVYDNTAGSGTQIASLDTTKVLGDIEFQCPFFIGLTIVTAGGAKITVVYE